MAKAKRPSYVTMSITLLSKSDRAAKRQFMDAFYQHLLAITSADFFMGENQQCNNAE
jgi:hypothetical protein